jgi:hypothetical protein
MATEGVGSFVASVAVLALGYRWPLVIAGGMMPIGGFLARRRIASLDVGVRVPAHEMAVLHRTELFATLPAPVLERLARNVVPLEADAGSAVIREGEDGDRFYVIERGEVVITREGRHLATRGPGDPFGEVALIWDVPGPRR